MTVNPRATARSTAVVSPVLMVWVTRYGVVVPRLDAPAELLHKGGSPELDHAARTIAADRSALHLLGVLARRGPVVDVGGAIDEVVELLGLDDADPLAAFAAELEEAGLLLPETTTVAAPDWSRTAPPPSPAEPLPGELVARLPVAFPLAAEGFVHADHDGNVLGHLGPAQISVLASFVAGTDVESAYGRFTEAQPGWLSRAEFDECVDHLWGLGLLAPFKAASVAEMREALASKFQAFQESAAAVLEVVDAERESAATTGVRRPVVIPVDAFEIPQLSLGMVMAYALAYEGGRLADDYGFAPLWYTRLDRIEPTLEALVDQPAVYLFSHYIWNSAEDLALAAMVKEKVPGAITVHGGPNVPKYPGDAERWFAANPQVDVAVHGEGEVTLAEMLVALAGAWRRPDGAPDLSVLADVPGLTFRTEDGVCRTADRDRIEDLDTIPSPYLTGLFEHRKRWIWPSAIFESNRGCPYGCTFCDWGSATLSRIRKFDLDRLKGEMEWAAKQGLTVFSMADANFGIFDRDVEIVEWVAELKRRYGAPLEFDVNFAKNRVGNLTRIVQTLADAGINTLSVASLQTTDEVVLKTIKRSNLKREKYDALTHEFRQAGFPLYTDVMIGLPGATVDTVRNDLQNIMDRELHARANPTQMLVNSPMNDPAYRAEHGLVAKPGEHLQESSTYTYEDWLEMMAMRRFYYFAERRGILRQVATYARVETGAGETAFFDRLRHTCDDPERWPHLTYTIRLAPDEYVPPGTWKPMIEELHRFCVEEIGLADDRALATALQVQLALLPSRGRTFPQVLELDHDYAGWHASIIQAKRAHTDGTWHEHVRPLREWGPGQFQIDDFDQCCDRVIGQNPQGGITEFIWELDAPTTRPKQPVD